MSAFIISILAVLSVIFLIIILDAILSRKLSYIITTADESESCIEAELRILLKQNPNSEILVIDKTKSEETKKILSLLEHDFPEIHILKADSN